MRSAVVLGALGVASLLLHFLPLQKQKDPVLAVPLTGAGYVDDILAIDETGVRYGWVDQKTYKRTEKRLAFRARCQP